MFHLVKPLTMNFLVTRICFLYFLMVFKRATATSTDFTILFDTTCRKFQAQLGSFTGLSLYWSLQVQSAHLPHEFLHGISVLKGSLSQLHFESGSRQLL